MNNTFVAETTVNSAFANVCDDSKQSMLNFRAFMDRFTLSNDDTEAQVNFISMAPQYRKRFHIPEDAVPQLMKLLQMCFRDGVVNHLHEVQDTIAHSASALVFEFSFMTDQSKIEFETVVPGFIRVLFKEILPKWIAFPNGNENHYCMYLATPKPEYDHSTQKYHSMHRIVIPSIMLDPDVRFFIYQRVWHSVDLKNLFEKKINYRIRECLVRSARKSPLAMLGSCGPNETSPLILDSVRKIVVEDGVCDGESATLSSLETKLPNTIHEASINHLCEGGVIDKGYYSATQACIARMEEEIGDDKQQFQLAYDDAKAAFALRAIVDREIESIYDVIGLLSDNRFDTIDGWLETMRALGSKGYQYYSVAVMVTKDRAKCRDPQDDRMKDLVTWTEFEMHWNAIMNSVDRVKFSISAIRFWASRDSPSQFARLIEDTIKRMLIRDVRDPLVEGRINHSHISSYLHFMFKSIYITFNATKSNVFWYEFVTEDSKGIEPGQMYKWRELGTHPDNLFEFISGRFKEIAGKVHSDLKSLKHTMANDDSKDDYIAVYIKSLYKTFHSAIGSIFNTGFKKSVIEDATVLFKQDYFIKQMNKAPQIMGVGNGVIEFDGPNVKLLTQYHTYPISLYTDTNYVPYDPTNVYIRTIMEMLRSLVPDDETDALDFLLFYFSTSLDWFVKESLFLIIHGGGCHAINTPIRMLNGSTRLVQHIKVGDTIMGDDHTIRTVQELFRGNASMFRITPSKGESFEVNDDHVLVLVFTGVNRINRVCRRGNKFHVEWFEHHEAHQTPDLPEPTKMLRSFFSINKAIVFLEKMNCRDHVVKNGDIIHIRVKELRAWRPWWIHQSILRLIKSDAIEYPAQCLSVDPYIIGMFIGQTQGSIPRKYKIGSVRQRLMLLAGILDHLPDVRLRRRRYELGFENKSLCEECIDVARSVGLGAKKRTKMRIIIYGEIDSIPCNQLQTDILPSVNSTIHIAFKVEPVGNGNYFGFELDGNHCYLTGDYVVHHNSNGKSVLLELFRRTLGERYAKKLPLSFITDQSRTRSSSTDSAMMLLKDARLAYYSESDRNEKVNIAKIKEITGGETLAARELYKEMENFTANCNHIVTTNHRFVIETTEHAVWRRFLSYKFKICFKHDIDPNNPLERKREPALISKIMDDKRYQEAFLAILIHYRSRLYSEYEGQILKVPHPTILRETEEYRQSEDIFQRFIMQKVYYFKGRQHSLDDLVSNFRSYYRVENGNPYSAHTADLIHNFRNTILQKYITQSGGIYTLNDFYTCSSDDANVAAGSIVFETWISTQ